MIYRYSSRAYAEGTEFRSSLKFGLDLPSKNGGPLLPVIPAQAGIHSDFAPCAEVAGHSYGLIQHQAHGNAGCQPALKKGYPKIPFENP